MPAFGCAAKGREVAARTRSIASSMATGPTLQLQPITSAPHSASFGTNVSGSEPSRQLPSSSIVTWATIGSEAAHIPRRQHGLVNFFQISESLENQQIDAAFDQRLDLLAKRVASFLERSFSQRFDSGSQRANRSCHPHIEAFGGLAGHAHASPIDVAHFVGQAVPGQAKRIATESIGFNNLGSRLQVFVVNSANQVGLREIQFVVRAVDENALGVEQRPHGAIAQHGGLLDPGEKVSCHMFSENTG